MIKKFLLKGSLILYILVAILSLVIMIKGDFTKGKGYGPGAYYYSDIPGWEKIFYPEVEDEN